MNKIKEVLIEYQKFNSVRNDFDAYLYALGEWALCGGPKPNPADYGVKSHSKALHPDKGKPCQLINNCPINVVKCQEERCPQNSPCR